MVATTAGTHFNRRCRAGTAGGFQGIAYQVQGDLLHLYGVRQHIRQRILYLHLDATFVVAHVDFGKLAGILQQTGNREYFLTGGGLFHESPDPADDFAGAMGLSLDLVQGFLQQTQVGLLLAHHTLGHSGVIGDCRQWLIDFMGKSRRHLAHGAQTGGVGQLIPLLLNHGPGILQCLLVFQLGGDIPEHHHRTVEFFVIQFWR